MISNIGGVLSEYNGMFKTKNGFKIIHEAGAKYSFEYTMFFNVKLNEIFLGKISKRCSYNGIDSIVTYQYKDYPAKLINLNDTLNHNCNCDSIWNILECMKTKW